MKIFITGGAGYVGGMLALEWSKRHDVEKIIALDKDPEPGLLSGIGKIEWISANTNDASWEAVVRKHQPDIIIHTAWQIREMYGEKKKQWSWNVEGSERVFDLAFSLQSVKKLIYFSTASIYGAFPENTLERKFVETDPLREDEYLYGIEKRAVEESLLKKFSQAKKRGGHVPQVLIVRPAAITGPRGRFMFTRFGLLSTLQQRVPKGFFPELASKLVSIIPAPKLWCRQYIHEDDVEGILSRLTFEPVEGEYEIFNIAGPGAPILGKDMAEIVGRKMFLVPPSLIRFAFFWAWHISRGAIPTSRGGWKFYSFPIVLDNTKTIKKLGYTYKFSCRDALEKNEGRYKEKAGL